MSVKQKPQAAFGSTVLLLDIKAGTVLHDEDVTHGVFVVQADGTYNNTNDKHVWMVFDGHMRHTNLNTGEVTDRTAGYCSLGIFDNPGRIQVEVLADTHMMCLPPHLRKNTALESLSPWRLKKGERVIVPAGTKLLLAYGNVMVENSTIAAPKQVRFSSGDKQVTAVADSYGLVFG